MRIIAAAAVLYVLLLTAGFAQVNSTSSLQPTVLEIFARQPTARIRWSKEVGRIESPEVGVVITALVIEDAVHAPGRMRGVRIDLFNKNARDQVYLEMARLGPVKKALDEIESEINAFQKEQAEGTYRCRGAAEFWHPDQRIHTLNAAYCIAPDWSGLSLSAYKAQGFRFTGHRPSELAAAIGRAMEELERRSR
ncbi:MAG TPA: hypothetical protein VJ875_04860 [Pyrinomonadaceae bacterium]|nr:hypothetical protein [Pyrinomonadaceae bacterium]